MYPFDDFTGQKNDIEDDGSKGHSYDNKPALLLAEAILKKKKLEMGHGC